MTTGKKTPIVMTIAGSDSFGGAGIQADLKTFSALGVHGTCVITAVTSQNTKGVQKSYNLPEETVSSQIESIIDDVSVDFVKTGMLFSSDIVNAVSKQIKRHDIPLVIDPVITAEAGGTLLENNAIKMLISDLIPLSAVITPNIPEASILSEIKILDQETAKQAAIEISKKGADSVVITGGHADDIKMKSDDIIYEGDFKFVGGDLIEKGAFKGVHGTGCTYSAALCAELAKGKKLYEAACNARKFVFNSIKKNKKIGSYRLIPFQSAKLIEESDRYLVINNVKCALSIIEESESFFKLIPEVGCNLGMAIFGATKKDDVASVSGRIVRLKDHAKAVGCVNFGSSDHVSRIILTVMQLDPQKRAAINIKYSKNILSNLKDKGMSISYFKREEEPKDTKTMDWGTSNAIKMFGRVPDVIYDEGGIGKEAMIRILGCSATEVVEKCSVLLNS